MTSLPWTPSRSKLFHSSVSDSKTSLKFVKKLVAIGISSIAYLRFSIPEKDFKEEDLGGLKLKLLSNKASSPAAKELMEIVFSAVGALEKGYLKDLMVTIFQDDPDNVIEMYRFSFEQKKGFSMTTPDDKKSFTSGPINSTDDLYKATTNFLQRLIHAAQSLDFLPDEAFLGVKIAYHDDTPPEYHAPGFVACSPKSAARFVESVGACPAIKSGRVASKWHKVSGMICSEFANSSESVLSQTSSYYNLDETRLEEDMVDDAQDVNQQLVNDLVGTQTLHVPQKQQQQQASRFPTQDLGSPIPIVEPNLDFYLTQNRFMSSGNSGYGSDSQRDGDGLLRPAQQVPTWRSTANFDSQI